MAQGNAIVRAAVVFIVSVGVAGAVAWATGGSVVSLGGWPATWVAALACFAVNLVAWVPASIAKTERFYDLVGTLTFLTVAALDLFIAQRAGTLDATGLVAAALVLAWAVRLGSFLVARIRRAGKDGRFDALKQSPATFFVPWTLQALWVFLTSIAAQVILTSSTPRTGLSALTITGFAVWALGFGLEVVADAQKARFASDPANAGRFITTGLWSWVRHPNYLGEITLWTGLAIAALPMVSGAGYATVVSPLFVFVLLRFVSGIPMLEQRGAERWGNDPAYLAYFAKTPRLLPFGPR